MANFQFPPHKLGNPSASWPYRDADGNLLMAVARFDSPQGKQVLPCTPDGKGGWQWKALPDPRPLYGLDRLAANSSVPVLVCEGEKAAVAAQTLFPDHVAVTSSGGANAAGKADWKPLTGRSVVIWPDADEPGRKYAADVARLCGAAGAVSVRIVDVPTDWPDGWDVADTLPQNVTADTLRQMLAAAEPSVSSVSATDEGLPKPLPDGLLPVPAFDFDLLPANLRPWLVDAAERMQCPPDYLAVAAIISAGAIIGRKVAIRPKAHDNWTERANLFGMGIGPPGVMKSPAMLIGLAPLKQLEAQRGETHKKRMADYNVKAMEAKLRKTASQSQALKSLKENPDADISGLFDGDNPEQPARERLMTNDSTVEALGELLRHNPNGLLVFRDELVSLLKRLDQDEYAGERGFYLQGWSGGSYVFDRIGRGLALEVEDVCLSLLGTTQPGRIAGYVRGAVSGGAGDDGLLQRFQLVVWPDVSPNWQNIDRSPDKQATEKAFRVFEDLDVMTAEAVQATPDDFGGLPYLHFAPDAQELFTEWRTALELRLRSSELSPALEAHFSKYRKLVPALSLIFHLTDGGTGAVKLPALMRALAWAEYLEGHALRLYGSGKAAEVDAARAILRRLRKGDLCGEFVARDVYRKGWANLTDRQTVHDALALLVDHDWLISEQRDTGGRAVVVYTVAPKATP